MRTLSAVFDSKYFLLCLVVLVITFSIIRIFFGVDLGDEAFHVVAADEWLKRGIAHGESLSIAQLSNFLLYPLVKLLVILNGSTTGLILFLRFVFLVIWALPAIAIYIFCKAKTNVFAALAAALVFFLFVPANLPAPSYNTISMSALIISVLSFFTAFRNNRYAIFYSVISGIALSIAVTAYPPLIFMSVLMGIISIYVFLRGERKIATGFFLSHAVAGIFILALFLYFTGFDKFRAMIEFMSALSDKEGTILHKLSFSAEYFTSNMRFVYLLMIGVLAGFIAIFAKQPLLRMAAILYSAGTVAYLVMREPILYTNNLDMIFLFNIMGLSLLLAHFIKKNLSKETNEFQGLFSYFAPPMLIFSVSGLLYSFFSGNGIINFPTGAVGMGALAVALILAISWQNKHLFIILNGFALCVILVSMGTALLTMFYGEIKPRWAKIDWQPVNEGYYAHLYTNAEQAQFIETATHAIKDVSGPDIKTFTVFGRLTGLYLMTELSPRSLFPWEMTENQGEKGRQMIKEYYDINQPDVILNYSDPWGAPLQPFQNEYFSNYVLMKNIDVSDRHLEIWINRSKVIQSQS